MHTILKSTALAGLFALSASVAYAQSAGINSCDERTVAWPDLQVALTDGDVLRVPSAFPSIQDAIDFAVDGDSILVAPGTYFENINFLGKAVTVTSESGPGETIIESPAWAPVVSLVSGEGNGSILNGFTIKNGREGIVLNTGRFSAPSIIGNIISDNITVGSFGTGIFTKGWRGPLIQGNIIRNNESRFGRGGAIGIFSGAPTVLDNIICNNSASSGGGIYIDAVNGNLLIRGNEIRFNDASVGGGIFVRFIIPISAQITQNIITDNWASARGGGIAIESPSHIRFTLLSNTVAHNESLTGSEVYSDGFNANVLFKNNVISSENGTAVFCGALGFPTPNFEFNDVFSSVGGAYGGACVDPTGVSGNISDDPFFSDPANGDYRVQAGSPVIDAGDNSASGLPVLDFDGNPRIFDGDGDTEAVVDMGAYEFGSHPPVPDLINDLMEFVVSQGFNPGAENPLLDKLNAALNVFENGNVNAAANILGDIIHIVEAKRGKKISGEQADELVAAAERIISILEMA